jgi:hypothetical protein
MFTRRHIIVTLFLITVIAVSAYAAEVFNRVRVWDDANSVYTSSLTLGSILDRAAETTSGFATATDSRGYVYVAYTQTNAAETNVYLIRDTGSDLEAWDNDTQAFVGTLSLADPIDCTTATRQSKNPAMVIDSNNNVYVAYLMEDAGNVFHVNLSRFNVTSKKVEIWDEGANGWSETLTTASANEDGIDSGTSAQAASGTPSMTLVNNDSIYIAYVQQDNSTNNHIYLSRYNTVTSLVEIWDEGTDAFTDSLALADDDNDGIDYGETLKLCSSPVVVSDGNNNVYVSFQQLDSTGGNHLYLSRYDGTTVKIWDEGANAFTASLLDANDDLDAIDQGTTAQVVSGTQAMAVDGNNRIYVAYIQDDASSNNHVYLSRYNGTLVEIWDEGANAWANILTQASANLDGIDYGTTGKICQNPAMAIDSDNNVYVSFLQQDANGNNHFYLSRYNSTTSLVEIWDNAFRDWTTTLGEADANSDGIDLNTSTFVSAGTASMMATSDKNIYIAYAQQDTAGGNNHIRISRYNFTTGKVQIWDHSDTSWTNTLILGEVIDHTTTARISLNPKIVLSGTTLLYIPRIQNNGAQNHLFIGQVDTDNSDPAALPSGGGSSNSSCLINSPTTNTSTPLLLLLLFLTLTLGLRRLACQP